MVILFVCTGSKYNSWWVNNLKYMLDQQNTKYEDFVGIVDGEGSVYDKLQLFKQFKENVQYLYFDLDLVIRDDVLSLCKKQFTLINAWWRYPAHTPLNSSIMSWFGNQSHIYDIFYSDEDYYRVKYHKGIDEYIFREINYRTYNDDVCWSYRFDYNMHKKPVCLFNQAHNMMKDCQWAQRYLLSE